MNADYGVRVVYLVQSYPPPEPIVVVVANVIFVAVVFAAALPGLCFLRSRGISALRRTHKHFTALAAILFVCCFVVVISWRTFFNGL